MEVLPAVEKAIERIETVAETPKRKLRRVPTPPPERQIRTRNFNIMAKGKLAKVEKLLKNIGCGMIVHRKERKLTIFYLEPSAQLIANRPIVLTSSKDKLVLEQFGTAHRSEFTKGPYNWGRWASALVWLRHCVESLIVDPHIVAQEMQEEGQIPPQAEVKAEETPVAEPQAVIVVVKDEPMEEEAIGEEADNSNLSTVANAGSDDEEDEGLDEKERQLSKLAKQVSRLEEEKNWLLLGMADLRTEMGKLYAQLASSKTNAS